MMHKRLTKNIIPRGDNEITSIMLHSAPEFSYKRVSKAEHALEILDNEDQDYHYVITPSCAIIERAEPEGFAVRNIGIYDLDLIHICILVPGILNHSDYQTKIKSINWCLRDQLLSTCVLIAKLIHKFNIDLASVLLANETLEGVIGPGSRFNQTGFRSYIQTMVVQHEESEKLNEKA